MSQLRQNPATKEWVIIATERAKRPEEFTIPADAGLPEEKDHCPFCIGNESLTPGEILAFRTFGTKPDTPGWWIRVIPNKFPITDLHEVIAHPPSQNLLRIIRSHPK